MMWKWSWGKCASRRFWFILLIVSERYLFSLGDSLFVWHVMVAFHGAAIALFQSRFAAGDRGSW